mgnify:CR=1 FL=1
MVDVSFLGHDQKGADARVSVYSPQNDSGRAGDNGFVVYTDDRYQRSNETKVAFNATEGIQMAVDGTATATITENIHDGNDNSYWTGNNLSGGSFNFSSTFSASGWPADGTQSIDGTGTNNNSEARIDKGSTLDLTPYTALRGAIYLTSWPTNGTKQVLIGFQDSSNVDLGVRVDIGSYINTASFNVRQDFAIPLSDLGVEGLTIQSIVLDPVDIGAGQAPNFYLDIIRLQDAGEGVEYLIEPDIGTTFIVNRLTIQVEDVYTASGAVGSFGKSGFLGESTLANGIILGRSANGAPIPNVSFVINDLRDWMQFPQTVDITSGSDGTNTWVQFSSDFSDNGGIPLNSNERESITHRIQDDLTGLVDLKVWASGYARGE